MQNKTITLYNVDIELLRKQQQKLLQLREIYLPVSYTARCLSGIIHFLDACVDAAAADPIENNKCPWCGCQLFRVPGGERCSTGNCDYKNYI